MTAGSSGRSTTLPAYLEIPSKHIIIVQMTQLNIPIPPISKMPRRSTKRLQGHLDTHKVALPRQGQGEREKNKSSTFDGKKFRLSLIPARSGFSPHSHNYTQKVAITYSRQGHTHVRSPALRVRVNTVPKISLNFT